MTIPGNRVRTAEWTPDKKPDVNQEARAMDEAQIRKLITRIVTGDGEQRENIEITDEEWKEHLDSTAHGQDQIEITMHRDDWMALIRIAREEGK